MKKALLFACLLLASCEGLGYEHTYKVQLDGGALSAVNTRYPYQPGERINADYLGGYMVLQEHATGNVRCTIVSEIKP